MACEFSRIPGVDFSDNYSPVVQKITYHILVMLILIFGCDAKLADVRTACLYGNLDEEIYMECPPGLKTIWDEILILDKCICGLIQAAHQYCKKTLEILCKLGFTGGDGDQCHFVWKSSKGTIFISLHIANNLMVGDKAVISKAIQQLNENWLVLKIDETLTDYLSCNIIFNKNRNKTWIDQWSLINKMEVKFGDVVKS